MATETSRQRSARVRHLLASINADHTQVFDHTAMLERNELVAYDPNSYHQKPRYVVAWCEKCEGWTIQYNASRKCCSCQSKETGLGNPEVHQRTIDNQRANGTFNMMKRDVQLNKTSNANLKHHDVLMHCDACGKETIHRVWKNKVQCRNCNFKNNGFRVKHCAQCNKDTMHNGSVCCECHPDAGKQISQEFRDSMKGPGICGGCGEWFESRTVAGLCTKCNAKAARAGCIGRYGENIKSPAGFEYTPLELWSESLTPEGVQDGSEVHSKEYCPVCMQHLTFEQHQQHRGFCSKECADQYYAAESSKYHTESPRGAVYPNSLLVHQGYDPEKIASGEQVFSGELCPCGEPLPVVDGAVISSHCSAQCAESYDGFWKVFGKHIRSAAGVWYREPKLLEEGLDPALVESGEQIPSMELCPCGNHLPVDNGKVTSTRCSDECPKRYDSMWKLYGPLVWSAAGFRFRQDMVLSEGFTVEDVESGAAVMPHEICANPKCSHHLVPDERDNRLSRWCSAECRMESLDRWKQVYELAALLLAEDPDYFVIHMEAIMQSPLDDENVESFNGIGGCWCKVDDDTGEILDIMATSNIAAEWGKVQQWTLDASRPKYRALAEYPVSYRLVKACSYTEALVWKAALAHCAQPAFWSPAPSQPLWSDIMEWCDQHRSE